MGRPLRADYGGESQARFEASMETVNQIWHIGRGRNKAICTMPGKKMLSKFKVPTQNKTVIIKWIPPLNVGPQNFRGDLIFLGAAALSTLRGGIHLMSLSRFSTNAVLITIIFPADGQFANPRGSRSQKCLLFLCRPGSISTQKEKTKETPKPRKHIQERKKQERKKEGGKEGRKEGRWLVSNFLSAGELMRYLVISYTIHVCSWKVVDQTKVVRTSHGSIYIIANVCGSSLKCG